MKTEAVIFDLDGVIVSTDGYHYKAWKSIADLEGIYFDEVINNRLRGVSRMESLDIILEQAANNYSTHEKQALADQKNAIYVGLLKDLTPADILADVEHVLSELKNKGIKIAIGSSSKNARFILRQIGLTDLFDAIADGNDISRSKPFPDVFLKAAEKLAVEPAHCIVVEDAIAGIEAAKRAGMAAAAVGDAKQSPQADYRLESLKDLLLLV